MTAAPARATVSLAAEGAVVTDAEICSLWELSMQAQALSRRTITERLDLVGRVAEFTGRPVALATRLELMRFIARDHLSPSTRAHYRSDLRLLYGFLEDEELISANPATKLPKVKIPRTEPNPVTSEQLQILLSDSGAYRRTRLMILLAAYQGLRAVEIAATHGGNIDWRERRILTKDAKGGIEVWRPIHPIIWDAIQDCPRDGYFFPNWKSSREHEIGDGHVLANSVSRQITLALRRAGIQGHRPHQLRGWFANELLATGASTAVVSHAMRHASPVTLNRYIKPSQELMAEAMGQLPQVDVPTRSSRRRRTMTGATAKYEAPRSQEDGTSQRAVTG